MIEGLNLHCQIGGLEIVRSPLIELHLRRQAVASLASIDITDSSQTARNALAPDAPVELRFRYRGEGRTQQWEGTVSRLEQLDPETLRVHAVGLEKKLLTQTMTESFYEEDSRAIARRLLQASGLSVSEISIPQESIPHVVFAHTTIAQGAKQLAHTLHRAFGHDLRPYALWLEPGGLRWSNSFTAGEARIASGENLLFHSPAPKGALGMVRSLLLPGLQHNQQVRIDDPRRGVSRTVLALEVHHTLSRNGNSTTLIYGGEYGWG